MKILHLIKVSFMLFPLSAFRFFLDQVGLLSHIYEVIQNLKVHRQTFVHITILCLPQKLYCHYVKRDYQSKHQILVCDGCALNLK